MWDKVRACRLLCIQYQIKDNVGGDSTLGFTERKYKHIVIKSSEKNNDRVWHMKWPTLYYIQEKT